MRRRLAIIAVNLAVFAVLAEAAGVAVYYIRTGGFFYLHQKTYAPIPEVERGRLTADALHPYFGPTHRPGHPLSIPESLSRAGQAAGRSTNNFGFVAAHDYPYRRRHANEFIIGIFGGSVGLWFCELGADRLVAALQRSAAFTNRAIVPLCFSHEGYKQPQQAIVLAYFLSVGQELDLVLNIDGFNEVALGALNERSGLDFSMPSVMHIEPMINLMDQSTLTPDKLESLAAIGGRKQRLNRLAAQLNRTWSAAAYVALEQYYAVTSRRLVAEQFRFAALPSAPSGTSVAYVTPKTKERTGAQLYEDIGASWMAASALMNDMLAARSASYVHVLQPNQYHTRRVFGEAEARVAINPGSPFKEPVEQGYPALARIAASDAWQRRGIRFVDATRIFDGEPSQVYVDDCCHYTVKGNEILADVIAGAITGSGR